MSRSPAAKRYARAIFDLANEERGLERISNEVRSVGDAVAISPELQSLLTNPSVSPAARRAVMEEVLKRLSVSPLVRNAVLLINDKRRANLLPEIGEQLTELADEKAGKLRAEVTSAQQLSEAQYARLAATLEKMTGRKISLVKKTDPTLIGGVVTRIGDKVYDGSVRQRLAELHQALLPN